MHVSMYIHTYIHYTHTHTHIYYMYIYTRSQTNTKKLTISLRQRRYNQSRVLIALQESHLLRIEAHNVAVTLPFAKI